MEATKSPNILLATIITEFIALSTIEIGLRANVTQRIYTLNFRKIPKPSFISELIQHKYFGI